MAGYWDALERDYRLLGVSLSSLSVHFEAVTKGVAVVRRLDEQLDCCGDLPGRRLDVWVSCEPEGLLAGRETHRTGHYSCMLEKAG